MINETVIAVTAPQTVAPFQLSPTATTGKIEAANVPHPNAPRSATKVASWKWEYRAKLAATRASNTVTIRAQKRSFFILFP